MSTCGIIKVPNLSKHSKQIYCIFKEHFVPHIRFYMQLRQEVISMQIQQEAEEGFFFYFFLSQLPVSVVW